MKNSSSKQKNKKQKKSKNKTKNPNKLLNDYTEYSDGSNDLKSLNRKVNFTRFFSKILVHGRRDGKGEGIDRPY